MSLISRIKLESNPESVIIYLCEHYSLTQKELATNLNLSSAFINDLVRGRRKLSSKLLKNLEKLFPGESRELWKLLHKICAQREGWNV